MKILTHFGHAGHQYELWKLPYDITAISNLGYINQWSYHQRPLHEKINVITKDDLNEKDYDVAIVHIDEFFIHQPEYLKDRCWGEPFKFFNTLNLPIIFVCHGTVRYKELQRYDIENNITYEDEINQEIRDVIGDRLIICNSHQAQKEWGFKNSKVIWHGFDPDEFKESTYTKNILAIHYAKTLNRAVYNGYNFYLKVKDIVGNKYNIPMGELNLPIATLSSEEIFKRYIDNIRQYTAYFNPTQYSPMPRMRGEAMMCGLCPVTADNHDTHMFIENGKNGFRSNSVQDIADFINLLCTNKTFAIDLGKQSRKTAIDLFHIDRYLSDWEKVLQSI